MFTDADGINWFFTALFNPAFLMLLLIFYFLGKFLGKLTVNINIWKVLALCYLAVFILEPLSQLGIISVVFGLGVLSNHHRLIFDVFGWAQNLGDILFAFRHRKAYADIRAAESAKDAEIEELKRQLDAARREAAQARQAAGSAGQSQTQQGWRKDADQRRGRKKPRDDDGGRSAGGGSSRGSRFNTGKRRKPAGEKEKVRDKRSGAGSRNRGQGSSQRSTGGQRQETPEERFRKQYLVVLGLDPNGSYDPDQIKAAFRRRAKDTHPDTGGSMAAFIEVKNAYDALTRIK